MDPIEIFELRAYVIDASASDPAGSAFLSEIRPYVIQVAKSPNALFATEIRAYAVVGSSRERVVTHATTAYVITKQRISGYHLAQNSSFLIRQPGIDYGKGASYSITQGRFSGGYTEGSVLVRDAGLSYAKGTMYTIEIP